MDLAQELSSLRGTLARLSDGDEVELAYLRGLLCEGLVSNMDGLERAAYAQDRTQLQFRAHTLKGVAACAGLAQFALLVSPLEGEMSAAELQARIASLRPLVDRFLAALRT